MVQQEKFKKKIIELLCQENNIEFLGESFNQIANLISEEKAEDIYGWINEVNKKNIRPIISGTKKRYKNWLAYQLLTFRYAFSIEKNQYRILLVKVKNSVYIEFHLGNHRYYDNIRKNIGVRETALI